MSDVDTATGTEPTGGNALPGREDGEALFVAMQARLDEITKLPLIRNDAVARRLLDDMGRAGELDDVIALLDQLDARVSVLLARQGRGVTSAAPRHDRAPRTFLRL